MACGWRRAKKLRLRRQLQSVVGDSQGYTVHIGADPQADPRISPGILRLEGVAQQVHQDLFPTHLFANHRQPLAKVRQVNRDFFGLTAAGGQQQRRFDHATQGHRTNLPGRPAGQVAKLVRDSADPVGHAGDAGQVAASGAIGSHRLSVSCQQADRRLGLVDLKRDAGGDLAQRHQLVCSNQIKLHLRQALLR